MVFSFAVAILVAARSISKKLAFQIFVGTNSGLHSAFYAAMGFMGIAAVLSSLRLKHRRRANVQTETLAAQAEPARAS
jgi:hypothetical protein